MKKIFLILFISLLAFITFAQDGNIDAAVNWSNGKVYLFSGREYYRLDRSSGEIDSGFPKSVEEYWPGLDFSAIDAALDWGNGKAYFFRGDEYIRYDMSSNRADSGYPKPLSNWNIPFKKIDAALNWGNGKVYFFSGEYYIRYDIRKDSMDSGYPRPINGQAWPGLSFSTVDAVFNGQNGKAYFFKAQRYVRYDISNDRGDEGYPANIADSWPELAGNSYEPNNYDNGTDEYTDAQGDIDDPIEAFYDLFRGQPNGSERLNPISSEVEKEIFRLTNLERTKRGIDPLIWDEDLAYSARYHAADMSYDNYFEHESYDRVDGELIYVCDTHERTEAFSGYWCGENIIGGTYFEIDHNTARYMVESWMDSPGHKENILNPGFTHIGVGYYYFKEEGTNFVQNFR